MTPCKSRGWDADAQLLRRGQNPGFLVPYPVQDLGATQCKTNAMEGGLAVGIRKLPWSHISARGVYVVADARSSRQLTGQAALQTRVSICSQPFNR